ncbi:hypothetical protein D3C85_1834060 [compost metagenome]
MPNHFNPAAFQRVIASVRSSSCCEVVARIAANLAAFSGGFHPGLNFLMSRSANHAPTAAPNSGVRKLYRRV